jgi:hypothetical protein
MRSVSQTTGTRSMQQTTGTRSMQQTTGTRSMQQTTGTRSVTHPPQQTPDATIHRLGGLKGAARSRLRGRLADPYPDRCGALQ